MIDWENLPVLSSPKRKMRDEYSRERLGWLKHTRRKHKPSKAHSTNKERSQMERAKADRQKKSAEKRSEQYQLYKAQVRAYWNGLIDEFPKQ